jgi:hypothetical protein
LKAFVQAAVKIFQIARAVKSLMKLISAVRSEFFMGRICSNSIQFKNILKQEMKISKNYLSTKMI